MPSVLLVIDMQEDFFRHDRLSSRRGELVRRTNELTESFRARAGKVIWVKQEFAPDLSDAPLEIRRRGMRVVVAGSPGAALLPELRVEPADLHLVKKRYSAFFGSSLDKLLARFEPSWLVVAGVNTHACVRSTVVDAYQRDYEVVLASECIDSHDAEHHRVSLRYMEGKLARAMSNEQLRGLLASDAEPGERAPAVDVSAGFRKPSGAATKLGRGNVMQVQYLEIVTGDVDAVCAAYAAANGVEFSEPDAGLGNARTAELPGGGLVGVRAPMHETEQATVRPYWLVDDIEAAMKAVVAAGGEVAHPPMEIPGRGTFGIYIQGGVQHGLWQR